MKTKTPTVKKTRTVKQNQKVGPWASVTENEAKVIRENIGNITSIAITGKSDADQDEMTVGNWIYNFVALARSAQTCLLLLAPTRCLKDQKPGPLADISFKEARSIRQLLEEAESLGIWGVGRIKRCKALRSDEFFGHFVVLKHGSNELEPYFRPEIEDDEASAESNPKA